MPVSDTTILAPGLRKHAKARSEAAPPSVWLGCSMHRAWRKGSNYGTIVVDLEHRVVVDVLADRSAATAADWFKDHPWARASTVVYTVLPPTAGVEAKRAP